MQKEIYGIMLYINVGIGYIEALALAIWGVFIMSSYDPWGLGTLAWFFSMDFVLALNVLLVAVGIGERYLRKQYTYKNWTAYNGFMKIGLVLGGCVSLFAAVNTLYLMVRFFLFK